MRNPAHWFPSWRHCPFGWPGASQNRRSAALLTAWRGLPCGLLLFFLPGASLCAATHEQRVIAAVIAGEASNQGRKGMTAVAEVIRQRVRESGWTPLRVVTHGNRRGIHAFSCLNRTTPQALVAKWCLDPGYTTALELAQRLCEAPEQLPDTTRGANFFTRSGEMPDWARGRRPVMVIKDHAFYRIAAPARSPRAR